MGRRIIGAAFLSLDGVMQAPGGPEEDRSGGFDHGGWLAGVEEEAIGNQVDSFLRPPFDLLLGRRTYDIFAAYWPYIPAENPISAMFATCRKFVLTRSERPLAWQGSERLPDIDAVAALKAQEGPDLVIQGSSTLYPQLLAEELIDRLVLTVAPVMLGTGKRLFGAGTPPGTFRAVETRVGAGGTVMMTLEPAGLVGTGTFDTPLPPSEAELARRESIVAGTW